MSTLWSSSVSLPSLCIAQVLKIIIQCLRFCDLVYRLEEVERHNTFICLLILNERAVDYENGSRCWFRLKC